MLLTLVHIHPRPASALPYEGEVVQYLKQASRWIPTQVRGFASEAEFRGHVEGLKQKPSLVLCEGRGKSLTSEAFAEWVRTRRDAGAGQIVVAIGPADGWSESILKAAELKLSLGAMTLPHALARLVVAEQVYRAATILGGHPYHTGH